MGTVSSSAPPAPPDASRVRSTAGAALWWVRTHRFTSAVTVLILVLGLIARPLFGSRAVLRWDMGTGYEPLVEQGHWWSPVTAAFFTGSLIGLVVALVLTVVLLGVAEQMMGTWRTALVFFATALTGPLAGVGLQLLGTGSGEFWSRHVTEMVSLDPLTAVAGCLLAASGFVGVLWRRRIRILTLLVLLMLLLYSGQPADLYRLLAGVAGLLFGLLLRRGKRRAHWARSSAHEVRVLSAGAVAITALGPIIALLAQSHFGPLASITLLLRDHVPDAVGTIGRCQAFAITTHCVRDLTLERIDHPGAVLLSIAPLVLLLLAAYGLLRGRRFAVWLAAAVNGMLGILSAFYFGLLPVAGLPYVIRRPTAASWEASFGITMSAVLPLAIAVALIVLRKRFPIFASRTSIRRYLIIIAAAAAGLAALYVFGGLFVRDAGFTRTVNLADLLGDVVERFIPVSFLKQESVSFLPTTAIGASLYYGVGPVFWAIVILAAIRPVRESPTRHQPGARARVRSLLTAGGGDSLSFMATWPNNSYWFDPEGDSAIAYRLVGRVALTIGGPFGSAGPKDATVRRFARFCDDNDWIPVFYSIDNSFEGLFRSMGWHSMVVAEETVLRPATWQTIGKKWQDVRTSINRAQRAGITATWTTYAALPVGTAAQLSEISEQWVADKDLPEMGFTLGGLDELRDPAVALMLATDENGQVQAVTSWLPTWRDGVVTGWTLDFMRRRPDSTPGVMEFLIAETAMRMREAGINYLSLSGAPLAHTATLPDGAATIDRILAYVSASLEPVYGFRSLLNFKRKFQPEFHPLLMAYPDPAALPAIGLALTRAYLPDLSLVQVTRFARSGP